jgi:hypothetical protein
VNIFNLNHKSHRTVSCDAGNRFQQLGFGPLAPLTLPM